MLVKPFMFRKTCSQFLQQIGYLLHGVNRKVEDLVHLAWEQDAAGIKSKLKEIIPEYLPYQP